MKYRTYRYAKLDPIFEEVRWRVKDAHKSGVTYKEMAQAAGSSTATLYNYRTKASGSARFDTVAAILGVFGARIEVAGRRLRVKEDA